MKYGHYLFINHNYNKILKSDWLSTALISFVNHSYDYIQTELDSTQSCYHYLLLIYSFTIIVIIIVPLPEHPLVQEFPDSAHVRYIKILMWLWGFLILFSIFGLVFFVLKSLLGIAKNNGGLKSLQFWPWSLRVMLEF